MTIYNFDRRIIDSTRKPWGMPSLFWVEFVSMSRGENYPFEFYNTIVSLKDVHILSFERQSQGDHTNWLDANVARGNKTALKVIARADTFGDTSSRMRAQVYINDSLEIDIEDHTTDFATYSIDVSDLGDTFMLGLGYSSTNFGGNANYLAEFADYWLE